MVNLHVITSTATGGAERQLSQLVKSHTTDEVIVFSLKPIGTIGLSLRDSGYTVFNGLSNSMFNPFFIIQFLWIVWRFRIRSIHGWMYHANLLIILSKLFLYQGPLFWNIRHSVSSVSYETKTIRLLLKLTAFFSPLVTSIFFNSKLSMKQHLKLGYNCSSNIYLPNGIDVSKYSPSLALLPVSSADFNFSLPENTFVIGLVSRYHKMKNIEMFLLALKDVCSSLPLTSIHCVIAGSNIPLRLSSFVSDNNIPNVSLLDSVQNVNYLYHLFDLFVSCSAWGEGFSNVIAEAMSSEVPVLATRVGDAETIIRDLGFICEPTEDSIRSKLLEILAYSPEYLSSLGYQSRIRIVSNYSLDTYTQNYKSLTSSMSY